MIENIYNCAETAITRGKVYAAAKTVFPENQEIKFIYLQCSPRIANFLRWETDLIDGIEFVIDKSMSSTEGYILGPLGKVKMYGIVIF